MFNPLKMAEMLSQASKMKEEVQRQLAQTVVEGTSGGGAVTVKMNGKKQLLKLHITPAALSSTAQPDIEMLEDLIVAAINDAGNKAEDVLQSSMKNMLGGLNLPGLS